MTKSLTKAVIYTVATGGILAPLVPEVRGFVLPDVTYGLHMTARVAFAYFLVVYFARPLREVSGLTWLVKYRRTLGLCVAVALTVHFGFVAAFFELSEQSIFDDMPRLYTGAIGVIALYVMAITSNNTSMRVMKRWWKRLHTFGIHYLWFFFFSSYVIAVQKKSVTEATEVAMFSFFLGVMLFGLALRIVLFLRRRAIRTRASALAGTRA